MQEILEYLKNNGERLDSEIAAATGISLAKVRQRSQPVPSTQLR